MNAGISTYFPLWTSHGTLRLRRQKFHFLSLLYPSRSTTWQAKRTSNAIGSSIVLSSTTTHLVIRCVCHACRRNRPKVMSRIVCANWALKLASLIEQADGFFTLLRLELSLLPTVTIYHQVKYRTCQLCNIMIHVL